MERCRARYGDTFTLRIHNESPWVILTDPDHIEQVFTGDPSTLCAGEANAILRPVVGRHSVVVLDEPQHMVQRKLMLPMFHGEQVNCFADLIASVASESVARWPMGCPFALWPRMQEITLEVIASAVFGPETERIRQLRSLLRDTINWATDPRRLGVSAAIGAARTERVRAFRKRMAAVDAAIVEELRWRREHRDQDERGQDILSQLLRARYEDGSAMTHAELRDELVTLLVVGHETTASALAWAFERLLRHPEILASLRSEIRGDAFTESDGLVSAIKRSPYLTAVIKETLRLRPVLPIVVRVLRRPMAVAGYSIPTGVALAPAIHLLHRREDLYAEPTRFWPERFLEPSERAYAFVPFGGGARRCLGASFAMMEMAIVIATVVRLVDLFAVDPRPERPVRRSIALTPHRGASAVAFGVGT